MIPTFFMPAQNIVTAAGGGGSSDRLLSGIANAGQSSGMDLCLDAGALASYSGSGLWMDQSGQGNHFRLGSTTGVDTTDPTFHGVAGAGSTAEYFSYDGDDYFEIAAGANPASFQTMHKDGASFSVLSLLYVPAGGNAPMLSTENGAITVGFGFDFNGSTTLRLFEVNGTVIDFSNNTGSMIVNDAWCAVHVSLAEGVANGFVMSLNGSPVMVGTANYVAPSASSASNLARIGARGGGAAFSSNGVRVAGVARWARGLLSADHAAIYSQLKTPFGLL